MMEIALPRVLQLSSHFVHLKFTSPPLLISSDHWPCLRAYIWRLSKHPVSRGMNHNSGTDFNNNAAWVAQIANSKNYHYLSCLLNATAVGQKQHVGYWAGSNAKTTPDFLSCIAQVRTQLHTPWRASACAAQNAKFTQGTGQIENVCQAAFASRHSYISK
eukprot:4524826-Amphidinium_carterae.1